MSAFTADTLDFSRLAAPTLVAVDFEARVTALVAQFAAYWENLRATTRPDLPAFDTGSLDQDPVAMLLQAYAYGDIVLRQETNDAANALRLAFAAGPDLDHIAQTYQSTIRKLLVAATSTTPAVYESDDEYRSRAQLAPEGTADFGLTPGGYIWKIRTAFADRVKNVYPINRGEGRVELRIQARAGDGTADNALISDIVAAFQPDYAGQATDVITVLPAMIVHVAPVVTLYVPKGPDRSVVAAAATAAIANLGAALNYINAPVFREAISAAAHVGSVVTVAVTTPAADIAADPTVAPIFDAATINFGDL